MKTRYVVKDENTLGFIFAHRPQILSVLAGSVVRGGANPRDGTVPIGGTMRAATLADFEAYRVMPPSDMTMPPITDADANNMVALDDATQALVHFLSDNRYKIGAALHDAGHSDLRAKACELLTQWERAITTYQQAQG